jgi:hypothetical protein
MVQRKKLIEEGGLVQNGDKYVFTKDTEFSSPSSAAAVIHGGSANGLTAWVNSGGQSLKELQRKISQIERRLTDHDEQIIELLNPEPPPKKRRIGY